MIKLVLALLLLGALLLATRSMTGPAQVSWTVVEPIRADRVASFRNPGLEESSGVAPSRTQPGVLWSHDDSGGEPTLYATDTLGRDLGAFPVTNATNVDWEDVALGPCAGRTCVYIADTGDNRSRRRAATIYRVPEPDVGRGSRMPRLTERAEAVQLVYPDQPRDVEALYVDPAGDVWLVSKRLSGPAELFRIPAGAWGHPDTVTAELVEQLPIDPGTGLGHWVTGAALAPDGRTVAVRTYREIYWFRRGDDGRLDPGPTPTSCDVTGLELQGEAIGWLDGQTFVLTSEAGFGVPAGVSVARCPWPSP